MKADRKKCETVPWSRIPESWGRFRAVVRRREGCSKRLSKGIKIARGLEEEKTSECCGNILYSVARPGGLRFSFLLSLMAAATVCGDCKHC